MAKARKEGPSFEELGQSLRRKKFAPLYFFYGEEDFLIEEAIDLLITQALDESTKSFNLDIVYGGETDAKRIVSLASSFPMMAERRVVVVRDFEKTANRDALEPYIGRPAPTTSLALVGSKPDLRLKLYKSIRENGVVAEFKQLYENEIPAWIKSRIAHLGKDISLEACQLMQLYVGRSLREIQNEIDKLFVYIGDEKSIGVDHVNSVVGVTRQYNVFELQKAIGQQNSARSQEILESMMNSGESPIGIVVMLTRYFQKLWLLQEMRTAQNSDYQLASVLGVSPFFVGEYAAAAKKFSSDQIKQCFVALIETDEALKTSSMDQRLAMTLLVYRLIRSEPVLKKAVIH